MGRAADPWRAAETWIRRVASDSVPLHAKAGLSAHPDLGHLPAEPGNWDRSDRLGEAGRVSDELLELVQAWIERAVRCVTKVRNGIPSRLMEASSTLHRLRPYRVSNRTDRRVVHGRCMQVRLWPTTLIGWTMADRRLSPYRSRASPRRKLPAFSAFARQSLSRGRVKRPRTTHSRTNDPLCPSPTRRPFCDYSAITDKVMRNDRGKGITTFITKPAWRAVDRTPGR
jgi:hypothetical protein